MKKVLRGIVALYLSLWAGSLSAADAPAPVISASLNSSTSPTIFAGWPLLLYVEVRNDGNQPLLLAPADTAWPSGIAVRIASAGASNTLPFALTQEPPAPSITLPPGTRTDVILALPGAATAQLAPGTYAVDVGYAIDDGTGWNGSARTTVSLKVSDGKPTPEQRLEYTLLAATNEAFAKRYDQARKVLNEFLATDPQSIPALTLMAEILERAKEVDTAYLYATAALNVYASLPDDPRAEPPVRLITLHRRLWQQIVAAMPVSAAPASAAIAGSNAVQPSPAQSPVASAPAHGQIPAPATPAAALSAPATSAAVQVAISDLDEQVILKDSRGQWASAATASSQYGADDYSALQATGAPDVPSYADSRRAWAPSASERQPEWLEAAFAKPMPATELRIRQSFNPGTIVRVELIGIDGRNVVTWAGRDATAYAPDQIAWFAIRFPPTRVPVQRARIVLDTPAAKGWKEIDAVQLVAE